jgi:hypothetical protein
VAVIIDSQGLEDDGREKERGFFITYRPAEVDAWMQARQKFKRTGEQTMLHRHRQGEECVPDIGEAKGVGCVWIP